MKRLIISSVTILLLFSFLNIDARPNKNKRHSGFGIERVQEELKLTEDQTKQFNDFRYNHQKDVVDLKSEIEKNRIEINKMMSDNEVNAEELLGLVNANSEIQSKIKVSKTNFWLNVHNILNTEQKQKWTKMFNRFSHKGKRMMHRMKGGGRGERGERMRQQNY